MQPRDALTGRRWLVLASAMLSFFAVGATFFAVPPLAPELAARFALDHLEIGVLMGAIAVPAIFLSVGLGAAVDRWPPRAAGNAGLALMAGGGVLFALAPGYPALLAGRLLFGVGGLLLNLLLARLVSTAFAGRELALAMGLFMSVYPASMIAIFSFHTPLLDALGWRLELVALAGLALVALPLHNLAVPRGGGEPRPPADATRPTRPRAPLFVLAGGWMLFFAAFAPVLTFAPEWGGGGRHALLAVTAVMWVSLVGSPLAGHLIDRLGRPDRWAAAGSLVLAVVLAAMAGGFLPPLVAMLLVGIPSSIVPTATYSLPERLAPAAQVGLAFGLITAFSNLGTVLGPAATGALRDATGEWPATWLLAAAAAVAAAALYSRARPAETA